MSDTRPTREMYFAIRIGARPRYSPYFMVGPDRLTPHLFTARESACEELRSRGFIHATVVKVTVVEVQHKVTAR